MNNTKIIRRVSNNEETNLIVNSICNELGEKIDNGNKNITNLLKEILKAINNLNEAIVKKRPNLSKSNSSLSHKPFPDSKKCFNSRKSLNKNIKKNLNEKLKKNKKKSKKR